MKPGVDLVKRWVNEAQQAVSSDNVMVQVCLDVWNFFDYDYFRVCG